MIFLKVRSFININKPSKLCLRLLSTKPSENVIELNNDKYISDDYSNVTPKITSYLGRNIHLQQHHPLSMLRQRIVKYFYSAYGNPKGNPVFSVYDSVSPIVTVEQNFDSLLIPHDHPSRAKSDCYYINREYLLRAHCTAHQVDLLRSGLDNFLIFGDVYRRDEIDATHFPVFHQVCEADRFETLNILFSFSYLQVDAARIIHNDKLFKNNPDLEIFEKEYKENESSQSGASSEKCIDQVKQPCHTIESVMLVEHEMKTQLEGLVKRLFGKNIKYKWVRKSKIKNQFYALFNNFRFVMRNLFS